MVHQPSLIGQFGKATYLPSNHWLRTEVVMRYLMAIQPSDLGKDFISSGMRLITQPSSDELLIRARREPSRSQPTPPSAHSDGTV